MSDLRVPPQDLEAEKAALGSMLLDADALLTVEGMLRPADFYHERHRLIFEAILTIFHRGDPIDAISLEVELKARGSLDDVGGVSYLLETMDSVPTAANAEYYARVVAEKAVLRRVIRTCKIGQQQAQEEGAQPDQVVDTLAQAVGDLFGAGLGEPRRLGEVAADETKRLLENRGQVAAVPTGFVELDRALGGGFHSGALYVLGARPSMGKTSWMKQVAYNAADRRRSVLVFSLEMTAEALGVSLASGLAGVNFQLLQAGRLQEDGWDALASKARDLKQLSLWVDDRSGLTMDEVRAQCRRLKSRHGLDLVVLDYLQLASPEKGREKTRDQVLTEVSYSLKRLAKDLRIPVVTLALVGRGVENRPNKRPLLTDLRESGGIEAAADAVMFLYRDAYYNPATAQKDLAEVIIAKQRLGPTGSVYLLWNGGQMLFHNLERRYWPK